LTVRAEGSARKRDELRKQVAAGTDPGEIRQLTKLALVNQQPISTTTLSVT
jgi:hypothetical protein